MKSRFFCTILFVCFALTQQIVAQQLLKNANPIIPGFNPDPSICRVGDDYYLVTSTFEYFPGVPIYHSKDLINWKMIGHVLNRKSQLNLKDIYSTAGIYAPTLRYHNGTFYMITTLVDGNPKRDSSLKSGNFIVQSKSPEGPWSDPIWIENAPGIDPSVFFDDNGKMYYCGNTKPDYKTDLTAHKVIWIQEMDPKTFQLKGEKSILDSKEYYENKILGNVVAFEGPHLYKKDGQYYLLVAHGGTGESHTMSIWKSNTPMGPWEVNPDNPLLINRDMKGNGINCTGHSDFIQLQNGDWYAVLLGVRSTNGKLSMLGRETFISKLDWKGTWPVYNPTIKPKLITYDIDAPFEKTVKTTTFEFEDSFNTKKLDNRYCFVRTPENQWWKIENKSLKIQLRTPKLDNTTQPSIVCARVTQFEQMIQTAVNFTPKKEGEVAGLTIFRGHLPNRILVKEILNGKESVSVYENYKLVQSIPLTTKGAIELKIETSSKLFSFWYKEKNTAWTKICEIPATDYDFPAAGRFTGSMSGMYTHTNEETKTSASFEYFSMKNK